MSSAYFDCFSGISGDMCLGALLDAGVNIADLKKELKALRLNGYSLSSAKTLRCGISCTKADVMIKKRHPAHGTKWKDIEKTVTSSALDVRIKDKGLSVFRLLFEAEAKVHGKGFDNVHLHELGGIDCLIDIFGAIVGLEMLGVEQIFCSDINLGSGTVRTEHGILPVPAPATAELMRGYRVYSSATPFELTTPTGAALLKGLEAKNSNLPRFKLKTVGCGAGNKEFQDKPNILRLLVGETDDNAGDETITVIETNIDDMNPQIYGHLYEKLFAAGALDVFMEQTIMKKGRPAVKLTTLATTGDAERLSDIIFRETTTIGIRFYNAERRTLERESKTVTTPYGKMRIKVAKLNGQVVNVAPEYDDAKETADKTGAPLKKLLDSIRAECVKYAPHIKKRGV
ncbi:MAG: nickel pincer cofactor biosynthesis protein LarC [Nitrospirae bacterium]|nr:MAG: nickel pincer cofactor biosynthesis protein LarC [Nitrospirota bacterium]